MTASDQTQQGLLEEVLSRIDSSIQISTSTNRTLQRALVFPRLKSIRQLGTTLMAMMLRIQKTTFKTYHTILSIQSQVCSLTAQCRLIETPSLLVDALGRRTPISPQFIDSWAAFEAVLKIRFEGLHGHPKVLSREYALQDNRTGLDLERDVPWHRQIIPGQEINMDVIFRSSETQGYGKGQCPGCKRIYEISDNKVKWYVFIHRTTSPLTIRLQALRVRFISQTSLIKLLCRIWESPIQNIVWKSSMITVI